MRCMNGIGALSYLRERYIFRFSRIDQKPSGVTRPLLAVETDRGTDQPIAAIGVKHLGQPIDDELRLALGRNISRP